MPPRSIVLAALLVCAAQPAAAQPAALTLTGTIEAVDAASITLRADGAPAAERFRLGPELLVVQPRPATLADIRPDDYIASAAVRGTDGRLHSTELRIFPAAMRGLGEGQRPMGDPRGQTMTNATVSGAAVTDGSNHLKVRFAGGESELVVDPGVPVTRMDSVGRDALAGGLRVRAQGMRGPEGGTVTRITLP